MDNREQRESRERERTARPVLANEYSTYTRCVGVSNPEVPVRPVSYMTQSTPVWRRRPQTLTAFPIHNWYPFHATRRAQHSAWDCMLLQPHNVWFLNVRRNLMLLRWCIGGTLRQHLQSTYARRRVEKYYCGGTSAYIVRARCFAWLRWGYSPLSAVKFYVRGPAYHLDD